MNTSDWRTALIVTGLVLMKVFVMPLMDRRISRKLGLDLRGRPSRNPRAEGLLKARQGILWCVFALYTAAAAYIVFFSRSASEDYRVHVALFEDLQSSVRIDLGIFEFFRTAFRQGLPAALSHVHILSSANILQVYLNVMLFVPMGYLLPYLFAWFREKVRVRPALACFALSLLIENLQLVTRRGFYDVDDLITNTAGGILGQFLFLSAAYALTHPGWRRELEAYRRWKRHARKRTLYPFARRMGLVRTTMLATSEESVWDFYVMKLGFRLLRQLVPEDRPGTDMLLGMGKSQVEVHCSNTSEALPPQTLTLSVRRLRPMVRRLEQNGIPVSGVGQDPYTGLRRVQIEGPDGVSVAVIEK